MLFEMETEPIKMGFPPIYNEHSKVLILGSFPSVKSREVSFYYGNKQNRFWRMLFAIYGEPLVDTIEGKREFLLRKGIALWDIATECRIQGSSDASLKDAKIADLTPIFKAANLQRILLNGSLAYELFCQRYADVEIPYFKMPSTSPANPRYNELAWREKLNDLR